jgi:predicted nucleic acid-binding protein
MNADRATYLDTSAIVKLVVQEPESSALRRYLRRKRPLVTSALTRTELARALLGSDPRTANRVADALRTMDVIRINDRVLTRAGEMPPPELQSLDAIHLATAQELGDDLARFCTYDERMADAANQLGWSVVAPS